MTLDELLALGSQPVRPDAPSGDPGRDQPEFESLQIELRKLELPEQPMVNWDGAVNGAAALLGRKSKDLLVAAYLAYALLERDGYAGFAVGLTVLRDLVANFWDTLYPEAKRMRGRVAAFEWLAERGAQRVRRVPPGGGDAEAAQQCLERVDQLHERLGPLVEGGDGLLSELRSAFREAGERRPAAAPSAAPTPSAAPSAAGPAAVESATDFESALSEIRRLLCATGGYLRRAEPTNPLAYRLPRVGVWSAVRQLPPQAEGKTQIPPPQPLELREKLEQLLSGGNFAAVLEETESRVPTSVFWLDLHRMSALALEGLGEEYRPAAEAVTDEVRLLLRRFPAVAELRFANDAPLANDGTRAWIKDRVMAAPAGEGAAAPVPAAAQPRGGEGFEEARVQARALARQKRLGEALALLDQGAARAGGFAARVAWRLELARLCLDSGQPEAALGRLEALDEELRRSSAEDWEPVLVVEVIKLLLQCRQRSGLAGKALPEEIERTRELMGRLCRLDVVAAVELSGRR